MNIPEEKINSFEAVYNEFYMPVYKYFAKRLNSKEVCEDLTGDVFYSCLKNFDRYDSAKASLATWIYSIAANKLKNYYRDKKETVAIDDTDIPDSLTDGSDMDGALYLTQMKTHLSAALGTVTERERAVVELRYFSDLNSEEIAERVGVSAGNVRVILTRTLKKLAKYFEDKGIRWE